MKLNGNGKNIQLNGKLLKKLVNKLPSMMIKMNQIKQIKAVMNLLKLIKRSKRNILIIT